MVGRRPRTGLEYFYARRRSAAFVEGNPPDSYADRAQRVDIRTFSDNGAPLHIAGLFCRMDTDPVRLLLADRGFFRLRRLRKDDRRNTIVL